MWAELDGIRASGKVEFELVDLARERHLEERYGEGAPQLVLLLQDKLHHLWWTPMLPVNFYVTAVAVGFAMVIFEATLSSRAFGLPVEEDALVA